MITPQSTFRTALLDPASPPPEGICNPDGTPATRRFDVYRNNVAVSLTEGLQTAFPVVRKLVGEDFFRAMAGVYLRQHPPTSPVMMFYGADMPDFIEQFAPAQSLPYLADVARLEFALRQSYHASDTAPLSADTLAQIASDDLESVRFEFANSVFLIDSPYPLHAIWWANTHGGAVPNEAQPALITRPDFDPVVDKLTVAQVQVTSALIASETIGEALLHGGPGFDFGHLLGLLLSRRALISILT